MHHKLRDLRRESTTDKLTGVLNRRGLDEAMALLQAEESPVSIVILDVDHFKRINDHYGHSAGDRALQRLAALMAEGSRIGDTLRELPAARSSPCCCPAQPHGGGGHCRAAARAAGRPGGAAGHPGGIHRVGGRGPLPHARRHARRNPG
ncbi:GGDEF domain-containing protein, partial [Achromobacter sp. DMS1]|uniref:GGDEF domain-containing protein n=1 Tax=Achromobacter sp. DMS1 TaxID=1688405 RepID=UPI001F485641